MEVKEAIKFSERQKMLYKGKYPDEIDKVIELLKHGEGRKETMLEISKIANRDIYPYANDYERLKYILSEIEKMNKGGRR